MQPFSLFFMALCVVFPVTAVAQKQADQQPVGIFPNREAYYQFMGGVKRAAAEDPEMAAMIPLINDIALGQPIGSTSMQYGETGNTLDLLSNARVRDELEMLDDQYQSLQKLNQQIQQRAAGQLRALDLSDRQNLVSQLRSIRDQAESELNAVLLPHQLTRLRQIRARTQLRNRSLVEILTSEPLKSDLKISDPQSEELRQAEREIQQQLEREIAALREKAREQLLSKLNRTQKEKVAEIFGESFEFHRPAKNGTGDQPSETGKRPK